ncbi:MAG: hypothetical protein NTV22_16925 [bacterium]|nr:hypothetical protein [bacterium]
MKITFTLALCACLCLCARAAVADNVISNGSFEIGDGPYATDWNGTIPAAMLRTNSTAHTGSYAELCKGGVNPWANIFQSCPVDFAGKTVRATCWVMSPSSASAVASMPTVYSNCSVILKFQKPGSYDAIQEVYGMADVSAGGVRDQWICLTNQVDSFPTNMANFAIVLYGLMSSGQIYYDDVVVEVVNSSQPPVQSLTFVQQPGAVLQDALITPAVQVRALGTNALPVAGATVTLALSSGSGALAGTLSRVTDGSGIAQFADLSLNQPGPKVLSASVAGSPAATTTSSTFMVTGPVVALAFATQPDSAVAGLPFGQQPVVKTVDAAGTPTTLGLPDSLMVYIALTNGTGTLTGTTSYDIGASAGNGVVTCSNLAIDMVGVSNQLVASTAPVSTASNTVAGAMLWLDANDPATLTLNGIRVQAWQNKGSGGTTGANLWFTQNTTALQPWRTNLMSGKPVLTFSKNGSGYGAGCTYLGNIGLHSYTNSGNQMTYFVIARQRNNSFGWQGPVSFSATGQKDGQGTAGVVILADGSQTAPYPLGIQRNHPATPMQADVATAPLLTPFLLTFVDNAGAATLQLVETSGAVRNNSASIVNGISPYTYGITDVTIGGRLEPSPATIDNGWEGDVAEVLVYNSALGAADRAAVETYLTNKWFVASAASSVSAAVSAPFNVLPEPAGGIVLLLGAWHAARVASRRRRGMPVAGSRHDVANRLG